MNRIILHASISLDGRFEGSDGSLAWHRIDEALHQHMNDVLRDSGGFHEGRIVYELMESYWPTADEQPDASPIEVDFAHIWRSVPKVVYSRTLTEVGPNATLVREVDPDEVRRLRDTASGDLIVGGANLARTFFAHDLIDALRIYVHPIVLGEGRFLFEEIGAPVALELVDSHAFDNGVVLLEYRVG